MNNPENRLNELKTQEQIYAIGHSGYCWILQPDSYFVLQYLDENMETTKSMKQAVFAKLGTWETTKLKKNPKNMLVARIENIFSTLELAEIECTKRNTKNAIFNKACSMKKYVKEE